MSHFWHTIIVKRKKCGLPPATRFVTEHILVSWTSADRAHISTYKAVAVFLEQWKGTTYNQVELVMC